VPGPGELGERVPGPGHGVNEKRKKVKKNFSEIYTFQK
jgi:hypothetical protein